MELDWSTTWLLVSTCPSEVRIMPVPAACEEPTTVLMSTMAGSTRAAICLASRLPVAGAVVGLAMAIGDWTTVGVLRALARPQPTPMPVPPAAIIATRKETTIQRQRFGSPRCGGVGGGGGGGTQLVSGAVAVSATGPTGWYGSTGFICDIGFPSASCSIWSFNKMAPQPLK